MKQKTAEKTEKKQKVEEKCQSFTRRIRVYQHEIVGEKVGENRGKFYLSPTVSTVLVPFTHINLILPTLVCRVKAALLIS